MGTVHSALAARFGVLYSYTPFAVVHQIRVWLRRLEIVNFFDGIGSCRAPTIPALLKKNTYVPLELTMSFRNEESVVSQLTILPV